MSGIFSFPSHKNRFYILCITSREIAGHSMLLFLDSLISSVYEHKSENEIEQLFFIKSSQYTE